MPDMIVRNRYWAERSLDRLWKRASGRTQPVKASAQQRKTKFSLTTSIRAKGASMIEGRAAKRKIDSKGWSIQVWLKQYANTGQTRIAARQAKERVRRFMRSDASGSVLLGSLGLRFFSGDGALHPQSVVFEGDS